MINLTIDWQEKKIDFMGEKVSVVIRPLNTVAFNLLLPHFSGLGDDIPETEALKRIGEMQKVAKDIFPTHLKEIQGLQVNEKTATIDELTEEVILSSLTVSILTKMMEITQPDDESEKN